MEELEGKHFYIQVKHIDGHHKYMPEDDSKTWLERDRKAYWAKDVKEILEKRDKKISELRIKIAPKGYGNYYYEKEEKGKSFGDVVLEKNRKEAQNVLLTENIQQLEKENLGFQERIETYEKERQRLEKEREEERERAKELITHYYKQALIDYKVEGLFDDGIDADFHDGYSEEIETKLTLNKEN